MPCLRVPLIRYVLPLGCGSPASNAFIEISRRISFSLNTSTAALARSSVEETISMVSSPFHSMVVSVPRKSNRVLSSLAAWFSALSTSWRSTLLTMSNDESATFGVLPRVIGRFVSSVHPRCTLLDASCRVFLARCFQAGCPSGQWERTVNPSANAYTGSNPVPATMVVVSLGTSVGSSIMSQAAPASTYSSMWTAPNLMMSNPSVAADGGAGTPNAFRTSAIPEPTAITTVAVMPTA